MNLPWPNPTTFPQAGYRFLCQAGFKEKMFDPGENKRIAVTLKNKQRC